MNKWSKWRKFPDPRKNEYLCAPFGAGVYELRHRISRELILFGSGKNLAFRMSSLLPIPHGCGTRRNTEKREYVLGHIDDIEYRTMATETVSMAQEAERDLRSTKKYKFMT